MDRINMDFLPIVNNHAKYVKEQKIAREMERKENAKIFIENLCATILMIGAFYSLYVGLWCIL